MPEKDYSYLRQYSDTELLALMDKHSTWENYEPVLLAAIEYVIVERMRLHYVLVIKDKIKTEEEFIEFYKRNPIAITRTELSCHYKAMTESKHKLRFWPKIKIY